MITDLPTMMNRRAFLGTAGNSFGAAALTAMMAKGDTSSLPHPALRLAPKAKRVIYMFQSGGPSHIDLFDGSPFLIKNHGKHLPPEVKGEQRVTGMTSGMKHFPVAKPVAPIRQCGPAGAWISDLLPWTQKIADKICLVRSMNTEAINHDPAITFINTGTMQLGKASLGAWLSYGLGSETENFPAYMVMLSQGTGKNPGQPIYSRLWGSGFLPSEHQGVLLRAGADPVLYLDNPPGVKRPQRRGQLDDLARLNQAFAEQTGDPETIARIQAYEMSYRMQASVPELTDLSKEPDSTFDLYGPESRKPGTYAANCLMARRLVERGVRCVQLFHRGWDQHIALQSQLPRQCQDTDQPSAALVLDLEKRGLLDETLVIWGGEFGRTVYQQGQLDSSGAGRDHHGRAFSIWMAGGGIKGGITHGETDDYCWSVARDPVHIRDLNATILHQLGIDHNRLVFPYRGLDEKITGVEPAHPVKGILT